METKGMNRKILLVEDDSFLSDIYQVKMTNEGFEVAAAMNGVEAIESLEKGLYPDLILLDIIMPYMDGMEVLRKVKSSEDWKNIPVILLTNLSDKSQIEECMSLGASDYLVKSHYTPSMVMERIYSLLNK